MGVADISEAYGGHKDRYEGGALNEGAQSYAQHLWTCRQATEESWHFTSILPLPYVQAAASVFYFCSCPLARIFLDIADSLNQQQIIAGAEFRR